MLAGLLGIIGFVLALFVMGALMESNLRKAGAFGAALVCCLAVILMATNPKPFSSASNRYIDWDGRSNSQVCD